MRSIAPFAIFRLLLCFVGFSVHLLLLYAVFDIYFSSPIVRGARPFKIAKNSESFTPADRIVFFSADGLRARTFYQHPHLSPFLHGLIRDGKAAWGNLESHVPTESRPGHVAMMAGFYEDVSAVTRGWKHNPVPFDSTLNQSSMAFLWGSPDIVHLFSENVANVRSDAYSPELEDFSDEDAAKLDRWVFDRVKLFFDEIRSDANAKSRLLGLRRAIFFLHLLGLDTNGHGHKPNSEQYLKNIATVDEGIRGIVQMVEGFFGDNRTAFLFTADHGMTDWGSHGDGTDDEVNVPFLAWGAGIEPSGASRKLSLAQVDLAPLQSALLGTAIPVNSFGTAPLEVLRTPQKYKFLAALANFKQMVEQYSKVRAERQSHSFRIFFTEAPALRFDALRQIRSEIERLAQLKRYEAAAKVCLKWLGPVHEALDYYHRYHRFSQGIAISALFFVWNFLLYATMFGAPRPLSSPLFLFVPSRPFCALLFFAFVLIRLQHLSLPNYLYFLSPIALFSVALNILGWQQKITLKNFEKFKRHFVYRMPKWTQIAQISAKIALYAFSVLLLVGVFFERAILSVIFAAISTFFLFPGKFTRGHFAWLFLSLSLAVFPLLPTVGGAPNAFFVLLAQFAVSFALHFYISHQKSFNYSPHLSILAVYRIHLFLTVLLLFTEITGSSTSIRPFAWLSLPLAFVLPIWASPARLSDRLILWISSLKLPFVLLSIGHEALFLPIFSIFLMLYVHLEHPNIDLATFLAITIRERAPKFGNEKDEFIPQQILSTSEFLRALFLVASIEMAFFGTGNIASLNSFNPSFLRYFVSVFSPFTMALLLFLKVLIPFFVLSLCFVSAASIDGKSFAENRHKIGRLSAMVAMITNTMAMVFFCCLRTDGSWLQIGISISNYVICLLCSAFVYLLLNITNVLLNIPIVRSKNNFLIAN